MSNIVSDEQLSWIPIIVILSVLVISLFVFEAIFKRSDAYLKIPYWVLMIIPFLVVALILLVLILTNVDIFIILLCAGIPFVVLAAFSFITIQKKLTKRRENAQKLINKYHGKKKWK